MAAPFITPKPPAPDADNRVTARKAPLSPTAGWAVLGWLGLAFLVIGGLDLLTGWIPTRFGNPEWEFGTVSRTFDNLPITALGVTLLVASVSARGIEWAMRATGLLALVLALVLLGALAVYLLDVPLAFRVVKDPAARFGLKRAVLKALVQGTLYPTVLATVGIMGIRPTLRARPRLS